MPVKNANKVLGNIRKAVDTIDKKSQQFVQAVVSDAGILSKTKAPLAYGLLVNSQSQDFVDISKGYIGALSYNTEYAVYLNGNEEYTPLWQPKPAPKYGRNSVGRYGPQQPIAPAMGYNPEARPRFLEYGFESPEAKTMIEANEAIFKI